MFHWMIFRAYTKIPWRILDINILLKQINCWTGVLLKNIGLVCRISNDIKNFKMWNYKLKMSTVSIQFYYNVASMLLNEGYLGISKNFAFIQTNLCLANHLRNLVSCEACSDILTYSCNFRAFKRKAATAQFHSIAFHFLYHTYLNLSRYKDKQKKG